MTHYYPILSDGFVFGEREKDPARQIQRAIRWDKS